MSVPAPGLSPVPAGRPHHLYHSALCLALSTTIIHSPTPTHPALAPAPAPIPAPAPTPAARHPYSNPTQVSTYFGKHILDEGEKLEVRSLLLSYGEGS